MVGGGFGGSAIALVPESQVQAVKRGVNDAYAAHGFRAPDFYDVLPADGARLL